MTTARAKPTDREHYSYAVYADPAMAEAFERCASAVRSAACSSESQERVITSFSRRCLADDPRRRHRHRPRGDRAGAQGRGGHRRGRVGRDARGRRRRRAADAHATGDVRSRRRARLAFGDRSFDAVVCLRVLMHTPGWRESLDRAVPRRARARGVRLSGARRAPPRFRPRRAQAAQAAGARVEAYRVFTDRAVRRRARAAGLPRRRAAPAVRPADRASTSARLGGGDRADRRRSVARLGLRAPRRFAGDGRGGALRVLVTGATGFTGGHLARALVRRGYDVRARSSATKSRVARSLARERRRRSSRGDLADDAVARRGRHATSTSSITSRRSTARPGCRDETYRAVNAGAVRTLIDAAARNGVRRVVHCSTVGVHGDVEHPPANEDAPLRPGDVYQETKLEGERIARAGVGRHRRRGRHRAADRHLRARRSPAAQAVSRRRAPPVRDSRLRPDLLSPDLHRRSGRGVPVVRRGAGRRGPDVHPGRRRGHDAQRAGGADCGGSRRAADRVAPAGVAVLGGRRAVRRRSARRSASSRRSTAGASTSSPRAARSTSRARDTELGLRAGQGQGLTRRRI